ncbi:histidine kinase [Gordoniibacillus kamchatkensis]|uniref:Histidine kinase n=1 Tax=Gordoniibacillus kamchatkensis TaxID=1590651 RepID=A0ABR5ANA4_9BACL|nr:response regulator [Paenibacillus sp. VKM B-2647]KIL42010.1 histidine kinase [Paenibacillus sp. VKM B-2647]
MAKILIADDESVLRMLIRDTLEDEGHEIEEASDGAEALEMLAEREYDLLVLDYMMPRMTGIEVIAELARRSEPGRMKILMLTAKSQQSDQEQIRASGADAFMAKPFSPAELARLVEEMCS